MIIFQGKTKMSISGEKYRENYDRIFRKPDKDTNIAPGERINIQNEMLKKNIDDRDKLLGGCFDEAKN